MQGKEIIAFFFGLWATFDVAAIVYVYVQRLPIDITPLMMQSILFGSLMIWNAGRKDS